MTNAFSIPRATWPAGLATAAGTLGILVVSLGYYGLYIDSGLNTADDGMYAQIAYELLLGTDPHELAYPYGLMWFKLGQLVFALTGPSWHAVQLIFYTMITATSVLLYLTVARTTRNHPLAVLAALIAVLVPAYPATAFYPFCALLNTHFQVRLAERWRTMRPVDVLAPVAAVSVTFQIRADFGFLFCVPLAGLLLLGAWSRRDGAGGRRLTVLGASALGMLLIVQLPVLVRAAMRGYLDLVTMEVLHYPIAILTYLLAVFHPPAGAADALAAQQSGAGTLLARPALSALEGLWTAEPDALLAVLIYGPLLVFGLFGLVILFRLARFGGERVPVLLVVLAGALATWPHCFLFRPDLPHVANFMPGFLVLACVLVAEARALVGSSRVLGAGVAGSVAALPLVIAACFLQLGLTAPGTGSIAGSGERTERFTAQTVPAVRVSQLEYRQLAGVRDLITAAAAPDERIVCVPFCPGMAFMTGHRMLLREYFVDDSFLLRDPGWIDRAIATTRAARPPVVVVVDWAIQGTELSRFQNWAHRYIDALVADGYVRQDVPGVMIYRRPPG